VATDESCFAASPRSTHDSCGTFRWRWLRCAAKLMTRPESVAQLSLSLKEWILAFAAIGVTSTMAKKSVASSHTPGGIFQEGHSRREFAECLQRRALLFLPFMRLRRPARAPE
jgi:hypothetical protein